MFSLIPKEWGRDHKPLETARRPAAPRTAKRESTFPTLIWWVGRRFRGARSVLLAGKGPASMCGASWVTCSRSKAGESADSGQPEFRRPPQPYQGPVGDSDTREHGQGTGSGSGFLLVGTHTHTHLLASGPSAAKSPRARRRGPYVIKSRGDCGWLAGRLLWGS